MTLATTRPTTPEAPTIQHATPRLRTLLQRAFFTPDTALKVMVNSRRECYFQWGWKTPRSWEWKKVKFNDAELGELLLVLEGKKESVSFYHSFDGKEGKSTTQIWVRRSNDYCSFKVQECSKSLNPGEQRVLLQLLQHAIVMMNLSL